ncbi:MAG: type 4a pilus biogenesis protein PilO [Actinomycetota bacterium]|nr:type 4a pilus biogenesis protein PilO [Actinomycetota bacterium]
MSTRIKIIIIVAIIIVIILLTVLVLIPNITGSIGNNTAIEAEKQNYQVLNNQLEESVAVKDEYYLLNAEYQKYLLKLPSESDISVITNELYDIADYSNVEINSIDYSEESVNLEKEKMKFNKIISDVTIVGSYYDVINFVNVIEKMPRIAKVSNVMMQSTDDNYESLNTYIKIEMYSESKTISIGK